MIAPANSRAGLSWPIAVIDFEASSLEQDGYIPCPKTVEQLRRALLAYCERDTLAMVEVYRALVRIAGESNGQASIQASTGASSPIAEPLPATAAETRLDEVTRLEVIEANGRSYVNWAAEKVTLLVQDEGQTLKVFCKGRNGAAPLLPTSPDPSE